MMLKYRFKNLNEATEFCKYINLINHVEIVASIGKNQEVDAKSLIGLLSLSLDNTITFHVIGDNSGITKVMKWFEIHNNVE